MNRGVPPTPRNARTGELTPPGIRSIALRKQIFRSHGAENNADYIIRLTLFFWFDGDGAEAREAHQAGRGAFGFGKEFSWRVVDHDF